MNKLGINRVWGIIIATAVFLSAFIFFNVLSYIQMDKEIQELEITSMNYNNNYQIFLQTSNNLRDYNEKIEQSTYELRELEELMKRHSLNYTKDGRRLLFSGKLSLDKFSDLLNYLSGSKTLKIIKLDTSSEAELPLLIGESDIPDMYIRDMEIELISINDKILGG